MRTALYRFTFPPKTVLDEKTKKETISNPLILLDLADLSNTQFGGRIDVLGNETTLMGHGIFHPSFGQGNFTAYFCAGFKGANVMNWGTFLDDTAYAGALELDLIRDYRGGQMGSGGGWFHFEKPKDDQILVRVGLSFISAGQACHNAENEIPDFGFEEVVAEAQNIWRDKLSVVQVDTTGTSDELQITFWSGLYRAFISPQNYTGENPLWESIEPEPYFDSFYCIWDSFRAQLPLLTIVDPKALKEMVRTLLNVYSHLGFLPDCRMSFCKGHTQVIKFRRASDFANTNVSRVARMLMS